MIYYIYGGSAEPKKSFEQQVKEETLEEAGASITDIKYSEWQKELRKQGYCYEGAIVYIFTAKYVNHPGFKDADPWDLETQSQFKFMDIDECQLRQEHLKALAMNKIKSKIADTIIK